MEQEPETATAQTPVDKPAIQGPVQSRCKDMHKVKRKETVFSVSREYGISEQELIAANHTVEETREIIGADSLTYLSIDGLIDSIGIDTDAPNGGLCVAYFDGEYPTPLYDYEERYLESLKEHTSFY